MKTALELSSGRASPAKEEAKQRTSKHERTKEKGRAKLSRGPSIQELPRCYCGLVVESAGLSPPPTFFISCPVSSAPFFTTLPVFLATFSVPLAVSLATTLVSCPVLSAAFSVPFAVSLATTLVSWPVLSAAFSVPFAVSLAATLVACPVLSATFSVPFAVSLATTLVSWPVASAPFFTSVAASCASAIGTALNNSAARVAFKRNVIVSSSETVLGLVLEYATPKS